MKIFIIIIISIFNFFTFVAYALPIPKTNEVLFDIIRKEKVIGSAKTTFETINEDLIINTSINISLKILFIPAYKFKQDSKEVWRDGEFINFEGYTDFEDDREYFITGEDNDENFIAFGMDGKIIMDKNILPLNYWNKNILYEKEIFDMQKGIVRTIEVKKLNNEIININNNKIEAEKFLLNASSNPKDKGPFPEYTIWYTKKGELLKFKFLNWKDNKEIITIRKNWTK